LKENPHESSGKILTITSQTNMIVYENNFFQRGYCCDNFMHRNTIIMKAIDKWMSGHARRTGNGRKRRTSMHGTEEAIVIVFFKIDFTCAVWCH
jgi:hypothetical protein